jgi:hypothetical protein
VAYVDTTVGIGQCRCYQCSFEILFHDGYMFVCLFFACIIWY